MNRLILDKQAIGTHTRSTQQLMLLVIAALLPGTFAYAYFISPVVIVNVGVAIVAALFLEWLALRMRNNQNVRHAVDGSIALAAFLLALAVPPLLPFWQLLVGVVIMVMLGKQVYGGLGHNPFNPAMVGYAALIISFPQNMTLWFAPGELQNLGMPEMLHYKLGTTPVNSTGFQWDGITQATPLEQARTQRLQSLNVNNAQYQQLIQADWLWVNLAFLVGGIFLLFKKIIQWHIPVSVIASFIVLTLCCSTGSIPIHMAVFSGALMLGAFFIATDPVTTASSNRGRIIFGIGVGLLTFVIREYGGFPEGIAFAILLMNLCVPLIDYLDMRVGK